VSFESEFFGPGNRLQWDAIRTGSLPADVQQRLGPFLEDLERDPEIVTLPRVRESGEVQWYVLCSSPRTSRLARDEVQAFLGPTYSTFEGRPTRLDPSDPVEAAVLAKYGTNAFRVDVPDRNILDAARERLRLLIRLQKERPPRHAKRTRAAGRVLRDFEYALLANQETAAAECIEELRSAGQLSAANLLFLGVRRLAAGRHWDSILALPELQALLAMVRPRRVTEALIRAVYFSYLKEFEQDGRAQAAIDRFRSEVWDRFRNLYQTRTNIFGFEIDASFLMAAACDPERPEIGQGILESYAPDSPARAYLASLLALIPRVAPPTKAVGELDRARAVFGVGDVDQAYELAVALAPSFDRSALLLRCAREMGGLSAAQVALESIQSLSQSDRARLDQHLLLSRMRDSLAALSTTEAATTTAPRAVDEIPSSWPAWLRRLTLPEPWRAAVFVAETGAREWDVGEFLQDAKAVQETADVLLSDRPQWGQDALRDALPYFLEFCMSAGLDARLKQVYESLFVTVAIDPQVSLPQTAALVRIAQARLELGVSKPEYIEIVRQITSAIQAIESPSAADLALQALEMLVNAACPNAQERQQFAVQVIAIFQRWYKRIDRTQFALLKALTNELEMPEAMGGLAKEFAAGIASSEWSQLGGKRIAIYSLQESALRRAALVISELSPGIRVDTFDDHVGGSPALRKAATTADVFILATAAAKHAATTFIEDRRPKNLVTLYARGQGSASLLEALREYAGQPSLSKA
jgi:hypothetical protein